MACKLPNRRRSCQCSRDCRVRTAMPFIVIWRVPIWKRNLALHKLYENGGSLASCEGKTTNSKQARPIYQRCLFAQSSHLYDFLILAYSMKNSLSRCTTHGLTPNILPPVNPCSDTVAASRSTTCPGCNSKADTGAQLL